MSEIRLDPESLLHLLWNGPRAVEVVQTAFDLGILAALVGEDVRLDELAARFELPPLRLYKLLDCLESLGMVERLGDGPTLEATVYRGRPGVLAAAQRVLGPDSIERDRERQPWRDVFGRLPELLRGTESVEEATFAWPPRGDQVASFEQSMTAGLGPFKESFSRNASALFEGVRRWLDVGGGDGSLAAHLLRLPALESLRADIFNLPAVGPLVAEVRERCGLQERLGFVGGDFFAERLPTGYDLLSFVRVLHDWPTEKAMALLASARDALAPGGRIAICEEFRTPRRLAAQFFWSWFLIGVDSCVSRLRDVEFYVDALKRMGFAGVQVLPGPMEIVTAVRA